MRTHVLLTVTVLACGGDNLKLPDGANPLGDGSGSADSTVPSIDAPADTVIDLGSGGANALFWDVSTSTLYLTDDAAGALETLANGASSPTSFATFPTATTGLSLGGIIEQADGSFVVASLGTGSSGTLLLAPAAGGTGAALTGLVGTRRRIGLAQNGSTLYSSYFAVVSAKDVGGVSTVAIDNGSATETEIAGSTTTAGLQQVVGLAVGADAVFVADATAAMIFKIDTANANALAPLATVPTVGLLATLPDGDLLTGGGPAISRITSTGTVSTLTLPGVAAFTEVRGMAYDPAGHRLFIVDHGATTDSLHVVPFTP